MIKRSILGLTGVILGLTMPNIGNAQKSEKFNFSNFQLASEIKNNACYTQSINGIDIYSIIIPTELEDQEKIRFYVFSYLDANRDENISKNDIIKVPQGEKGLYVRLNTQSPQENEIVANWLATYLNHKGLLDVGCSIYWSYEEKIQNELRRAKQNP